MLKIGFIGLGNMGLPMAINLIKANYAVTGFDLNQNAIDALVSAGGKSPHSLQEIAQTCDVVITMLQTHNQVRDICLSDKGLFTAARPNTLWIDCSSIDVTSSIELQNIARAHQIHPLDAPVSGGVVGARNATLTFMVGGEIEIFNKALNILNAMGKKIIHTGASGSGQAAKICNNMILGVTMIAVSEAFNLAKELKLDAKKFHEVLSNSSGQSWVTNQYLPVPDVLLNVPANNDYQPGFTCKMMLKDLDLSQHEAHEYKINTPMGALAQAIYQKCVDNGTGSLDFSSVIKLKESS